VVALPLHMHMIGICVTDAVTDMDIRRPQSQASMRRKKKKTGPPVRSATSWRQYVIFCLPVVPRQRTTDRLDSLTRRASDFAGGGLGKGTNHLPRSVGRSVGRWVASAFWLAWARGASRQQRRASKRIIGTARSCRDVSCRRAGRQAGSSQPILQ
jgi:hypothetical protein